MTVGEFINEINGRLQRWKIEKAFHANRTVNSIPCDDRTARRVFRTLIGETDGGAGSSVDEDEIADLIEESRQRAREAKRGGTK